MRRPAPGGVRNRPPIRAKACTNLPFRLYLEVVHQFEEDLGARALADGVTRAQDPRRPLVVALEYRGGNKRDQRVCERVLVWRSLIQVRLSRTNAIASSAFPLTRSRQLPRTCSTPRTDPGPRPYRYPLH